MLIPEVVAGLIGPDVRVAKAYWLARNVGDEYHDFLQEEPDDRRTVVMAEAMKDGFGTRFEPLLVLPELLDEDDSRDHPERRSQRAVLSEILACGYFEHVSLYGVALSPKSDPQGVWAEPAEIVTPVVAERIENLRAVFTAEIDPGSIATQVIEVSPDLPDFNVLFNNALCNSFASYLQPRMLDAGFAPDVGALAGAICGIVTEWNDRGMFVSWPLSKDHFNGLADTLYNSLMHR
jgi:hypothetical protein